MLARRKFLQVFGVATASAPLAAKAMADAEIAKMAGLGTAVPSLTEGSMDSYPASSGDYYERQDKVATWLRAGNLLPDSVIETLRQESEYVEGFDIDIAAKKSWSMAVKVQEQRARNLQRKIERVKRGSYRNSRKVAEKLLGFEWPW